MIRVRGEVRPKVPVSSDKETTYLPYSGKRKITNASSKEHGTFQIYYMNSPPWATRYPDISFPILHLKPGPEKKKQRTRPRTERQQVGGLGVLKSSFLSPASPCFFTVHGDPPVLDLEEIQETASVSQEALLFTL